ncbi:MAG: DNA mismatch repair protein MutS [Clostridia bacterium]|nr:DNA mismatch repair protein MutS [Clostridia bacterium]
MKQEFLSKKNFADLDLGFVFDRLPVVTPYGESAKKSLRPLGASNFKDLEHSFDLTERIMERLENKRHDVLELKSILKEIKQLANTFDRIEAEDTLSVTELFEIKHLVMNMAKVKAMMEKLSWEKTVGDFLLHSAEPVMALLDPENSGVGTFYIYSTYSAELETIRASLLETETEIKRQTKAIALQIETEGFKVNANGEVRIQQIDRDNIERAKQHPHLSYRMDIPLYSLFRIKPDPKYQDRHDQLLIEEEEAEYRVRIWLTAQLKKYLKMLRANCAHIGQVDLLIAKGQFAAAFQCVRPKFESEGNLSIVGGRHLKVAYSLDRVGKSFTPVDIDIHKTVTLITGANMGGKTVSLRMIGQVIAMAHYGFLVPCKQATLYPLDFLFISVGDSQSIDMGLSTFGAEIVEIGQVIRRFSDRGLILIDELARGTNPKEGYAISKALIEHLQGGMSKTLITTHYDGLTQGPDLSHYQVNGLKDVNFEDIRTELKEKGIGLLHEYMDYRLTEVSGDKEIPKEALRISEMMGLAQTIIERAKEILGGSHDEQIKS